MKPHLWPKSVDVVTLRDPVAADIDSIAGSWHADLAWMDGCTYAALAEEWHPGNQGDSPEEAVLIRPRRHKGSRLTELPGHELRTAASIDELLAEERDR